jgi:DNA polymerase I-like protein with 3'-5' exonuclease and polymerase domains
VIPLILDYRSLRKLKGTYVDTLPEAADPADAPRPHQLPADRGRHGPVGQQRPNLQNIPSARKRAGDPQGLRAARRELPACSAPTIHRSNCASSPT